MRARSAFFLLPSASSRLSSVRSLSLALPLASLVGMAAGLSGCHDACLVKPLPQAQLCNCPPREDEVLARIAQTELPYPVRSAVMECSRSLHDRGERVSREGLNDCIQSGKYRDLGSPTQQKLITWINESTLQSRSGVQNWSAQCYAVGKPRPLDLPATPGFDGQPQPQPTYPGMAPAPLGSPGPAESLPPPAPTTAPAPAPALL